ARPPGPTTTATTTATTTVAAGPRRTTTPSAAAPRPNAPRRGDRRRARQDVRGANRSGGDLYAPKTGKPEAVRRTTAAVSSRGAEAGPRPTAPPTRENAAPALRPTPAPAPARSRAAAKPIPGSNANPGASPFRRRTAPNSRSADTRSADTRSAASRTAGPSAATAGAGTAATARPLPLTAPPPRTQPATRTPLHIVAPPDPEAKARRRRRLWVGALVSLACAGLFAIVGVRVLLAQGQGPVDKLESQVSAAQAENQRLRLDVARLESPSRIVAEAQARLGMVPPAVVIYLPAQTPPPAG
ncbi:MAG: hypothetical protein QOH36_1147, partial [Actinomycetota bacterium]|nr:hypothetical protein [Actinomycetota bacterium]